MSGLRSVLHVDCDNYYASVEEKYNPALSKIPFAVCGNPEMRHSIVMSKNSLAKKAGVITGISYSQARQICPALRYVKADMTKYLKETKAARAVYSKYSDNIQHYGMDESWIELAAGTPLSEAKQIADVIRIEIMYALGLSASVGVSFNYIFSKIASDYAKPNATTVISRENYKEMIWHLPASSLLFIGSKRKKLLMGAGIATIGDIAKSTPEYMGKLLGKAGVDLWQFANGNDRNFDPSCSDIGSISHTITPPKDLHSVEHVSAVVYLLAAAVSARLKEHKLKTWCVSICMRDNKFNKEIRQRTLKNPADGTNDIFNVAFDLFNKHYKWAHPLRSLGVRADRLDPHEQLSLLEDTDSELSIDISSRLKKLTEKFGRLEVEQTAAIRL